MLRRIQPNYRRGIKLAFLLLASIALTMPLPGPVPRPVTDGLVPEREFDHGRQHYLSGERPTGFPTEAMVASWYGEEFGGLQTASGEIFDPELFTAAHKTLPLGTRLQVENPDNQMRVEVTVNDRGPFIEGRDLDLSARAFRSIANPNQGVIQVNVTLLAN